MRAITPPDKTSIRTLDKRKYRVYFYGRRKYFGSKKAALAYQTLINTAMSKNVTAINALCAEIYSLYRSFWPQLENRTRTDLADNFQQFDRSLYLMVSRSHHADGTTHVFRHYENAGRYMNQTLTTLLNQPDTKRSTFTRHRITELRLRSDHLLNQVSELLD